MPGSYAFAYALATAALQPLGVSMTHLVVRTKLTAKGFRPTDVSFNGGTLTYHRPRLALLPARPHALTADSVLRGPRRAQARWTHPRWAAPT